MRKGSALLIVLGMLSFMVISAVSFSIFMRQSRAPSSYLRRNIAARYLVRAALANVLEDLEGRYNGDEYWGGGDANGNPLNQNHFFGIYDDPYPGCGPDRAWAGNNPEKDGDCWMNRVFMPFGPIQDHLQYDDPALATVPTLTLEALAYLPPAIIDDVRKLSRLTRTACWRSLPYESGRFAYTAVNVSDLFDVNRLRASEPRDSGLNRITLASLCAAAVDTPFDIDDAKAEALDRCLEAVEQVKVNGNVVPFTSLADFNFLASGEDSSHLFTPFMKYIGTTSANMLQDRPETANALFVTDTWFPAASAEGNLKTCDLAVTQPFKNYNATTMMATDNSLNNDKTPDGTKIADIYQKNLGPATFALYDYLDGDSQPISLAFPTTEAVPMVVGVGAPDYVKPKVDVVSSSKSDQRTIGNYKYTVERKLSKYVVTSFGSRKIMVQAAVMNPFRRLNKTNRGGSYQIRGVLRFFLTNDTGFMGRPSRPMGTGVRDGLKNAFDNAGAKTYSMGVASFSSDPVMLGFSSDIDSQRGHQDWIKDVTLQFDTDNVNIPIIQHVEETWTPLTNDPDDPTPPVTKTPVDTYMGMGVNSDTAIWRPIADSGAAIKDGDWVGGAFAGRLGTDISEPGTSAGNDIDGVIACDPSQMGQYRLCASLWFQVIEGSGAGAKVYDMVPACAEDDEWWLSASPANPSMLRGDGCPLLNFVTDYPAFRIDTALGGVFNNDATFACKALYAVDPRYNHAPENWFYRTDGNNSLADKWCTALKVDDESASNTKVFGTDGRDRDVFMFVSDQEYLQSIGELQFLPALRNLDGTGSMLGDNAFAAGDNMNGRAFVDGTGGITAQDLVDNTKFANGTCFWSTYTGYNNGTGDWDKNIYALPANGTSYRLVSGADGFKVNPYSDDDRVLAAALVGTPFDYYVASTNDNQRQAGARRNTLRNSITSLDKMRDYSFCEDCDLAKITDNEMTDLMGAIRDGFAAKAASGSSNWEDAWSGLAWQSVESGNCGDNNKIFLGDVVLQKPLYGVDRKFLYSFWRDCFDNRQQLFLIFVRAEPVSFGGAAAASQLGGRAVALVWRDPAKPEKNVASRPSRSALRGSGNSKSSGSSQQGQNKQSSKPSSAYRQMKRDYPPHRTRVLFYHQFD